MGTRRPPHLHQGRQDLRDLRHPPDVSDSQSGEHLDQSWNEGKSGCEIYTVSRSLNFSSFLQAVLGTVLVDDLEYFDFCLFITMLRLLWLTYKRMT